MSPLRLSMYVAAGWLILLMVVGLLVPWLPLPYAPGVPDLGQVAVPPSWHGTAPHYLGTDPLGRDVLTSLLYGARRVVLLSLPAAVLATLLGALLGGAAGYWGNRGLRLPLAAGLLALGVSWWWLHLPVLVGLLVGGLLLGWAGWQRRTWLPLPLDSLVLGLLTLLGVIPRLVLLLALAAGPPLTGGWLLALLALLAWPEAASLVRIQMRQVRVQPYVEAARALGLPTGRVWWRHALPAACLPLRTFAPLTLATLIGLESTLGFLGIGTSPTAASWGQVLGTLRQEPGAWWLVAVPGTALLATLLALQALGRRYPA